MNVQSGEGAEEAGKGTVTPQAGKPFKRFPIFEEEALFAACN